MFRPRIGADSRPPRYSKELTKSLNELGDVKILMEARKAVKKLLNKEKNML